MLGQLRGFKGVLPGSAGQSPGYASIPFTRRTRHAAPLAVLRTNGARENCACKLLPVLAGYFFYTFLLGVSQHLFLFSFFFFSRPEFVSEFSKLAERWQSAARAVQQRKCDIDRLVTQWRFFTTSVEDLLRFLADTSRLLSALKERDHSSPCQTRRLIHELRVCMHSLGGEMLCICRMFVAD